MIYKKLILAVILSVSTIGATNLHSNDFCKIEKVDYNNTKCIDHVCSKKFCSINKNSCDDFKSWTRFIDFFAPSNRIERKMRNIRKFVSNIKECSNESLLKSKICYKDCYEHWSLRIWSKGVNRITKCTCATKLAYDCGSNYCADKKDTCDIILESYENNLQEINKC